MRGTLFKRTSLFGMAQRWDSICCMPLYLTPYQPSASKPSRKKVTWSCQDRVDYIMTRLHEERNKLGVSLWDIKKASLPVPKSKSNIKWEDHNCACLSAESEREQGANEKQHACVRQAVLPLTSFSARLGLKQTLKHSQNNKQAFINSAIYIYIRA